MYVAERQRRASQGGRGGQIGSAQSPQDQEAWLRSLELEVTVEPLTAGNLARASQLFNKTNQMNLATRRLSDIELTGWVAQAGRWLWTFSVTDRFGASGLTGIVSLQVDKDRAEIVDFILSCRVMGRNIEETMLAVAVAHARRMGVSEIRARYRPTARNGPCLGFWAQHSGFAQASGASAGSGGTPGEAGETWFVWDARRGLPLPEVVNLRGQEAP
jgi:FkbH-like protein